MERVIGNLDVEVTLPADGQRRDPHRLSRDRRTDARQPDQPCLLESAWDGSGTTDEHELTLMASNYTPVDANLIPTGEIAPVAGTPLDFTTPHPIGERVRDNFEQLLLDAATTTTVLDRPSPDDTTLIVAARVVEQSGRTLEISTTEPGIQFYSGFLDATEVGAAGKMYPRVTALRWRPSTSRLAKPARLPVDTAGAR